MIQRFKQQIFPFILIQLYFLIYNIDVTKTLFSKLKFEHFIPYILHVLLFFIIFIIIIKFFYKNLSIMYFYFICIFFEFFILFKQLIKQILSSYVSNSSKYFIYAIFILIIVAIILKVIHKSSQNISKFISFICITFTLLNLYSIYSIYKNETKNEVKQTLHKFNKPDTRFIFIILDEMTNMDIINNRLNAKIELPYLILSNFKELKNSHSIHKETIFSINNIFNLGKSDLNLIKSPINLVTKELQNNYLIKLFNKNEYKIINQSIFEIQESENKIEDNIGFYFFDKNVLIYSTLFANLYVPTILFIDQYKFNPFNKKPDLSLIDYKTNKLNTKKEYFLNSIKDTNTTKQFEYYHFLIPHEPYCYDSMGKITKNYSQYYAKKNRGYINNVKYTLNFIEPMIDNFLKSTISKNTILVIQGDHGTRAEESKLNDNEKKAILNLVYLPDKNYKLFNDSMTNVDVINTILKNYYY